MYYVPHFKYAFKKVYALPAVDQTVISALNSNKQKLLFFGNLSYVKGIDTVVAMAKSPLYNDTDIIIAGKNVDDIDFSEIRGKENIHIFDRHINDDELIYMYSHTDFVLLPYKKSSQSGIFAMAAYFKKPMILSDIPYFRTMIEVFPSFGYCVNSENYIALTKNIILKNNVYFKTTDCEKFEDKVLIDNFIKQFSND